MPANRAPNIDAPLTNKDGTTNVQWWKFWKSLGAQFSGADAPVMPVNVPGVLSVVGPQGAAGAAGANGSNGAPGRNGAAGREAAQEIVGAQPTPAARDRDTADLAFIASRPRAFVNREAGALDLATIALARIRPAPAQQPQILICTQATFPALAGTGATFIYVSDFAHWIYWDGTAPTFADAGSDYYAIAPAAPGAVGWHAVDGSTVSFLNADGTLTAKTLKNVAGTPAYLKVGAGADTLIAPTAPTFAGVSATPAGTVPAFFTGTPQTFATAAVTAIGTVNALITPDPYTPAGTVAAAFAGVPATPAGTISTTGEPENFYSTLWFRL
jgi:hypothetical protein